MATNKQLRNAHAKRYIQEVFEARLLEEGFRCPDDKLLCWYRIRNQEIVNSIIFFTLWPNFPLMMDVGYGIYPLFADPFYIRNVQCNKRPSDERFLEESIIENVPINAMGYRAYSDSILVDAPSHEGKGIYTFDGILLPQMDAIGTFEEAYLYHKSLPIKYEFPPASRYATISRTFIEMAYTIEDEEMYPHCRARFPRAINMYEQMCARFPKNQEYLKELACWKKLQLAFEEGRREEYLTILDQRKNANLRFFEEKWGIVSNDRIEK